MGTIITFPAERPARAGNAIAYRAEQASIVILPVIRIERHEEPVEAVEPNPRSTPGRKRRKR